MQSEKSKYKSQQKIRALLVCLEQKIQQKHTGQVVIDVNFNQGGISNIFVTTRESRELLNDQ